jgi:hypothetical protein
MREMRSRGEGRIQGSAHLDNQACQWRVEKCAEACIGGQRSFPNHVRHRALLHQQDNRYLESKVTINGSQSTSLHSILNSESFRV